MQDGQIFKQICHDPKQNLTTKFERFFELNLPESLGQISFHFISFMNEIFRESK
jgi:hypothetical protein